MPFTVGTAGHIDHGKTWLVRALTGKDTDRLPGGAARAASPSTSAMRRSSSPTGAGSPSSTCRATSASCATWSRARPGSTSSSSSSTRARRPAADPRAPGDPAAARDRARRGRRHEGRRGRPGDSWSSSPRRRGSSCPARGRRHEREDRRGAGRARAALGGGGRPGRAAARHRADAALRRPRLHPARNRDGRHRDALVGIGRRGRRPRAEPAGLDVRVRSVQVHDRPVERAEAGQRVAVALPGVERTQLRRGDALVAPAPTPLSYRLDVALDELDGDRGRLAPPRPPRHRRARRPGRPRGRPRAAAARLAGGRRAATASSSATGPRSAARPSSTRRPPGTRAPRPLERGDPARSSSPRSSASRCAAASSPTSAARRTARARPATGSSPPNGSRSCEPTSRARSTRPTRSTRSRVPAEPWAREVPRSGVERRGARLYLPGVASLGSSARPRRRRLEAELAEVRAHAGQGRGPRAGALPRSEEGGSSASATASLGARPPEGEGPRRGVRERGLDHPRALPRPARHGPQAGPAPPRALRRGRPHAARRRRARTAPPGQDRLATLSAERHGPGGPAGLQNR